jgi:hypothetical protein
MFLGGFSVLFGCDREEREFTVSDDGIVNLSNANSMPSSPCPLVLLAPTIKYFGSRRSRAAILPGSRVRVAEKSNFWHDDSLFSTYGDNG